ncbi:2-hydroxyacid dehydrogenase [Kineococcus xinjiangensis]|uniref:2-hydroxyacid dehydrogenase n=1 Tax=Kineococcus xinjiangensis TaxID=512762 RepID=UPI001FEA1554|nr:2-hydroxyacid dehydrogenase [Kineococcus xinjiangensis]
MPGPLVVSLPDPSWLADLGPLPPGVTGVVWDLAGPAPEPAPDVVVPPYMSPPDALDALSAVPGVRLVQSLSNGYDGVLERLPEHVTFCNAGGVHDTSTAELAVALALTSRRGIDTDVRAQAEGTWRAGARRALADSRALVVGWGGVGRATASRLAALEVAVTAVGTRARREGDVQVHSVDGIADLLPQHDLVVLACPLTERTRGLVDAAFLAAMPDGALLVNVARGPVVDTEALLAELATGRLWAALDVTDPEPLPLEHPLWRAPQVVITPHVGGNTSAFRPRALRLLAEQVRRLAAGEPPRNVIRAGSGG